MNANLTFSCIERVCVCDALTRANVISMYLSLKSKRLPRCGGGINFTSLF